MTQDSADLKKLLNPRDRGILDAQIGVSWVPPNPREILLPYQDQEDPDVQRRKSSSKQEKAMQVFEGYGKVIDKCKTIEAEIEQQCKYVKVSLNPKTQSAIIAAVGRVFGTDGREITFEMYKKCIKALADLENNTIPTPGDKNVSS